MRLSPTVRRPFRWHFGPILERCGQALVEATFPFTVPLAERVVFEAVSFEVFWPWMLGQHLRPAHPNAARSMWQAMGAGVTTGRPRSPRWLRNSYEFTRLLPRSDLMDAVLRGDEAAMRNPVLNDTVELARSLWPNCSARPAGALIYYTVRPHATGTGSTPYFYYTVRPHATGTGSTPYFWGGELEAARLLALEATVQGMALDAELSKTARR